MMKLLDDVVDVGLERLTKPSEAILARRTTADSTGSTARSGNNARRVLLAALSKTSAMSSRQPNLVRFFARRSARRRAFRFSVASQSTSTQEPHHASQRPQCL